MNLVEAIIQSVTQLPPFPAVIQRVLQLVEDPKSSARDVVEVIQYDQSITANVLMVCNSAYFGARRPIHSLGEALVRIGFNNLVEIVLTRGTSFLFFQACQGYQLQQGELWRHSVACALLSQILAGRLKQKKSPIQFTATLLHDVGKVVLGAFVKDHFEEIRRLVNEENQSFLEAEKKALGIDHAELGGRIAEGWNFPPDIVAGIRYHHTPFLSSDFHDLVSLAYLCDVVALMTGIGGGCDGLSYHGHREIMEQYALKEQDLEEVISELESGMKRVEGFLTPR
jgi:putative nucleotidyltransferase with HDIG domain